METKLASLLLRHCCKRTRDILFKRSFKIAKLLLLVWLVGEPRQTLS